MRFVKIGAALVAGVVGGYYIAAQKALRDLQTVQEENEKSLQQGFQMAFQSGYTAAEKELNERYKEDIKNAETQGFHDGEADAKKTFEEELDQQIRDIRVEHEKELGVLGTRHKKAISETRQTNYELGWTAALAHEDSITKAYEKLVAPKLNKKKADLKKEYDTIIDRQAADHQRNLDEMRQTHQKIVDGLKSDYEASLEQHLGDRIERARQEGYKQGLKDSVQIANEKQTEMVEIANLLTDMTIGGASNAELARAVRHSMVVIDAENKDRKQSEIDNGIPALKEKYSNTPE